MKKENVEIKLVDVDVRYWKIWKDFYFSVNGKEVRVYVDILQDAIENEYKNDYEISESDIEGLTQEEYKAFKDWSDGRNWFQ